MTSHRNPTVNATRRYQWQFGLSMLAYAGTILLSRRLSHTTAGPWQIVIALLPAVPVGFVFASIVRYLLATDELRRRMTVDSLALAGGVTALCAVTYGLLESDSVPRLSAWWTYVVFMASWIVSGYFVRRRYQ